jgi:hypothetical protein
LFHYNYLQVRVIDEMDPRFGTFLRNGNDAAVPPV